MSPEQIMIMFHLLSFSFFGLFFINAPLCWSGLRGKYHLERKGSLLHLEIIGAAWRACKIFRSIPFVEFMKGGKSTKTYLALVSIFLIDRVKDLSAFSSHS